MLTVTSPTGGATLASTNFVVTGTCSSNHTVTIRLVFHTGQFHDYYAQPSLGAWSKTLVPLGEGSHSMTVTCEGMPGSITVNFSVGAGPSSTDPPLGP